MAYPHAAEALDEALHIGLGTRVAAVRSPEASFAAGSQWSFGFRSDPILKSQRGRRLFCDLFSRAGPLRFPGSR